MTAKTDTQTERPPIIAVLGHVDHGKSSLLDYIRKSNTVAGEAGGITQHAAAYEVEHQAEDGSMKRITFIDTPGHAAFSAIRARGASIADIAILVVSAEEGVKAQTLEALESIQKSGIPFVVAINKIDRPNANVEQTKYALLEHGVYLEGLGGEVPFVPVSAKTGEGIPDLLDILLLVAQMQELTGNPNTPAEGFVMEAEVDPKRGIAATMIITNGSIKSGSAILADTALAPVRIMEDHAGNTLKSATFSTPITIVGFDELPPVGAPFTTYTSKKEAERARAEAATNKETHTQEATEIDGFSLPVIIKADATGSLEAIQGELAKLASEHACVRIIHSGIGSITEGDVKLALGSHGALPIILGFGVTPDAAAVELARQHDILIEHFDIIYKLSERAAELLKERTPKRTIEVATGKAKILKVFSSNKTLHTVGAEVKEGSIATRNTLRVTRGGDVLGKASVETMQVNKAEATHADEGTQFGTQIAAAFTLNPGDILEAIEERVV